MRAARESPSPSNVSAKQIKITSSNADEAETLRKRFKDVRPRIWRVFHIDGTKWLSGPLAKGDTDSWPCNDTTWRNDWGLIYASKPVSALIGLLTVTSHADAYEDGGQPFLCDVKCRAMFRTPLTLDEMKKAPELGQGPLVQQEFQDGFGPPRIEDAILNRLAELIPELSRLLTRSR